ncbi:MAG: hypothetical protein FWD05_09740 [Oscillospiraceae bacterium]|nr:hypothetical protein [Oscillospiraceae bacterium]
MNNRKEMIDFAMAQMAGFTLEGSSDGDNRSVFGLIKTLIESVTDDTLEAYRKPLQYVLNIKVRDPRDRFMGSKLALLQQTVRALFGFDDLLSDKFFTECDHTELRNFLFSYLETCRRIFITRYVPTAPVAVNTVTCTEPVFETDYGTTTSQVGRKQ